MKWEVNLKARKMETIEFLLNRTWQKKDYTIGQFTLNGVFLCHILELPVNGTHHGKTAIPAGRYEIDMSIVSPKYKDRLWAERYDGIVPTLVGVPGRSRILMHPGNSVDDTDGCLLPGINKVKGRVVESLLNYYDLMDSYLMKAKARGQKCYITIVDK